MTFLAIVCFSMSDFIMVLNFFSNYWHREAETNRRLELGVLMYSQEYILIYINWTIEQIVLLVCTLISIKYENVVEYFQSSDCMFILEECDGVSSSIKYLLVLSVLVWIPIFNKCFNFRNQGKDMWYNHGKRLLSEQNANKECS